MKVSNNELNIQSSNQTKRTATESSSVGNAVFARILDQTPQSNREAASTQIQRDSSPPAKEIIKTAKATGVISKNNLEASNSQKTDFMKAVEQAMRDNMLGIDREKIEELEQEMEAIKNNPTLSADEKSRKLEDIQQQIDSIIKAAVERTKEKLSKESLYGD